MKCSPVVANLFFFYSYFAGPLLGHIIQQFRRKQADLSLPKLFQFYVGHDVTIMLLLEALGVFDNEPVPFCATVLVELRSLHHKYIVTVSAAGFVRKSRHLLYTNVFPSSVDFVQEKRKCKTNLVEFELLSKSVQLRRFHRIDQRAYTDKLGEGVYNHGERLQFDIFLKRSLVRLYNFRCAIKCEN